MLLRSLLCLPLLCLSTLPAQNNPAPNPKIQALLAELAKTRTPQDAQLSPDGRMLAWTVGTELHLVATDDLAHDRILSPETAADATNTKVSACASGAPAWSADSAQLAFLSDCEAQGGKGAQQQIWVYSALAHGTKQLTHLKGNMSSLQWSPDGKTIAFLFVENATRHAGALDAMKPAVGVIGRDNFEVQQVESVEVATGKTSSRTRTSIYAYEFAWSPNSQDIAFIGAPAPGENNWWIAQLYLAEEHSSKGYRSLVDPNPLSGPLHGLQIAHPQFSPDGKDIAFIGGLMSDFGVTGGDMYIVKAEGPGAGKDTHPFTAGRETSVGWFQWTDPDHVLVAERKSGKVHVAIIGTSGKQMPFFEQTLDGHITAAAGDYLSLSASLVTRSFAMVRSTFEHGPEVFYGTSTGLKQVSHLNDALQPQWGKSESVEYANDGFHLQGYLLYPAHYDPARHYGLITYVHGGPSAANDATWPGTSYGAAPFSALDYFVFLPNPRGSFGQGEAFTQANRKDFGHGDLSDILAGIDTLEKRLPIDREREGITGWSYGGYMTMFAVTQTTRFKAAVAGAGIANWQSYYGQNSIDQWMTPFFGTSVYDDPAVYAKSSPITFIKQANTPTLMVVGDRDGECPAPQSFEFWHALRAQDTPAELVVYPDEGHRFSNPEHRIDVLSRALAWFSTHIPAR